MKIGSGPLLLSTAHCIPEIKLKKVSCSRLHEKGVTTTITNVACYLTDRSYGVTFAETAKGPSDGLFVTTISAYPRQNTANNAHRSSDDQRYKMKTLSVGTVTQLWHHILGHAYMSVINVMMKRRRYGMLPSGAAEIQNFCHVPSGNMREIVMRGA